MTMTTDSDLVASSDEEARYQRVLREYKTLRVQRARNAKLARRQRRDAEEAECIRKAQAVQAQRDRWKAVSARYYLKHPEIKEKKQCQNVGEKGSSVNWRVRRWDPPKAARRGANGDRATRRLFGNTGSGPGSGRSGDRSFPPPTEALKNFLESEGGHDAADMADTGRRRLATFPARASTATRPVDR
ncbi:hypothetical protein B0H14DRAFT_2656381 [Mycena olivaceomarginata]|nr:hypothetical protein B0H14DRAFT_2656381 [Mycena olivaceomarginata]